MYFGSSERSSPKNALTMPPFLAKAEASAMPKKEQNNEGRHKGEQEVSLPQNPKKENNRLNLLELLNFKNITMDNDRITILALCLLLSSENADELLLLALIYIML
jgi:hypothetical protein